MDATRWDYRVLVFKDVLAGGLMEATLADYGAAGWELVGVTTVVKSVNLSVNELVAVLKRPSSEPIDRSREPEPATDPAGWI